jgi:hypothetical protein
MYAAAGARLNSYTQVNRGEAGEDEIQVGIAKPILDDLGKYVSIVHGNPQISA